MIERAIDKRADQQQAVNVLAIQQARYFKRIVVVVDGQCGAEQIKPILAASRFNASENRGIKRIGQRQIVFARPEQDADLIHGLVRAANGDLTR